MSPDRYFSSEEKDDVERNRLELQESYLDPITTRRFEMLEVTEGSNCLEVGAGTGSMAKWLANRIGPKGKVVATDINTRFLHQLSIPNLEIRQHDIIKDDLEINHYDLVHCRAVLMHLTEPEKGLERMASATRTGGWLLIEELDYGSVLSTEITNASAIPFTTTCRALYDAMRKKGVMDPYFGRRLRGLMERLQFVDLDHDGWTRIVRGGDTQAQGGAMTLRVAAKPMIDAGLLTEEQYENARGLLLDPSFYYLGATVFGVWGKRPANQA